MPKHWEMSNGELQEVHTPFTTRAAELQDLYKALAAPVTDLDARRDVLLNIKWTVQEFDCRLLCTGEGIWFCSRAQRIPCVSRADWLDTRYCRAM